MEQPTARARQRAYTFGVFEDGDGDLSELEELLRTAGVATVGEMVQRRDAPHPNVYLGPGKVEDLKHAIKAADANLAVADDELTPRQQRNLEKELDVPVLDRTSVILDIFADHAHTAEGKLQVELAQLEYNLARMRGLWTHLERLGGGIGTRGPGESQIETDRRLARDRISALRRRLKEVQATRSTQRAERERAHLPTVALAGYTNAGKSTLLNAITGTESVSVRDRLFHTLDPTTRTTRIEGRTYLVTDTVGFIRKLPHGLVEAFAATLEETIRADLLLHVVDASAPEEELDEMLRAVDDVLEEIGADGNRLLVLNKADALDADDARGGPLPPSRRRAGVRPHRRGRARARRAHRRGLRAHAGRRRAARPLQRRRDAARPARAGGRPRSRGHAGRRPGGGAAAAGPRARGSTASSLDGHRCGLGASSPARCCRAARTPATPATTCARWRTSCSARGSARWSAPGIAIELPEGHAGWVVPRSGLAARHGIALVNAPGLIDAGYRGEVKVLLLNTDHSDVFRVQRRRAHRAAGRRRGRRAGGGRGAGAVGVGAGRGRLRLDRHRLTT